MAAQAGILAFLILTQIRGVNAVDRDPVVQPAPMQQAQGLPRAQRRAQAHRQQQPIKQQTNPKTLKIKQCSKYNPKSFSSKCRRQGPR